MLILAACAAGLSMIFALLSFFRDSEFFSSAQRSTSPAGARVSPTLPLIIVETPQTNNPSPTPSTSTSATGAIRQTIVNDALFLLPGRYRSYRFVIDGSYRNPRVTGYLAVQSGGNRDVYLTIVDEQGLQNYSNGLDFNFAYRIKVFDYKKINVGNLQPGIYYVILGNTHARLTGKQLEARLTLESD